MARYSYYFYNAYLCFMYFILLMIFTLHIGHLFFKPNETWACATFLVPVMVRSTYDCLSSQQDRQTARWFLWNRYVVALLLLVVNFALPASNVIEEEYSITLTIIVGTCLMIFVFSIYEHAATTYHDFRLSFPKKAKLSSFQFCCLILFHILLVIAFLVVFRITPEYISTYQSYYNNQFLRIACHLINIMSIPLNYCAVLAWNCEKLNFKGIHPVTKRRWVGVMKKDKKGTWVVDVEPEDHRIFLV
ncbi:Protein CBG10326 [Caenorhabditis briggsae]|uniref:Uncharacterized protein n=2 Tax=Caenorhabditis briggsae TaxID=6238 RepID=A0AAE9IW53_CAEBR|nr:Protein CBG10326 [Caenorhabditis briggsae]ULU08340.1 hypothetical protein L3Y34_019479 [Caenorhabditis briggsae]CAP29676.1 Protein CBG10326 [Caenorhabditis briggsae]